jgi:hypothetical protein
LSTNLVPRFYCLFDFRNLGTNLEHFKRWQSKVDQMSKSSSSRHCIWHMDRVAQTPGRKDPKAAQPNSLADRPCFMLVWPVSLRTHIYLRSRRPRHWRKLVEAAPPSRSATWLDWAASTWCQTSFSKSVELPHSPINTPLRWKWEDTRHFGDSTCNALILCVVAMHSLVGRMVRL